MDRTDRRVTAFAMLGHASFHALELAVPLFVTAWLDQFAVSTATLGLPVGAAYALTGLGAVPSGLLADRFGGKPLVLACMAGMGLGFLVVAVAPTLAVLGVGLVIWGAAASLYHPAGLTMLSRETTDRGTAFAYHGVAGNLGVAVGPLLAALLLAFVGWRTVAALLVAPLALALSLALRMDIDADTATGTPVPDGNGSTGVGSISALRAESARLFRSGFLLVFLVGALYGLYYRGAFTFLPELLAGQPVFAPVTLGGRIIEPGLYVYSGLLLLGGLGQYAGGKLVERVPAEHVLVGTFAALALVALAFVPAANAGLGPLLVVAGLLGFLVFLEAPVNQEVISRQVPPEHRGLSFGYTYAAVLGVGAAGAAVAGVILARWSAGVLFTALGLVAVLALVLGAGIARQSSPD